MAFITSATLAALIAGCQSATTANTNDKSSTAVVNTNTKANANTQTMPNAKRSLTREEFEKDKARYEREAKELGSRIGEGAEDLWLWTKARADLLVASGLTSTGINVDVDNSIITLRGTVPDAAQKTRAEELAKAVAGNKGVRNQLTVTAQSASADLTNRAANRKREVNVNARGNTNSR